MTNTPSRRAPQRVRGQFLRHLKAGRSVRAAAAAAGAPRSSLYKWRNTLPEFAEACRAALGKPTPARLPKTPPPAPEWIENSGPGPAARRQPWPDVR